MLAGQVGAGQYKDPAAIGDVSAFVDEDDEEEIKMPPAPKRMSLAELRDKKVARRNALQRCNSEPVWNNQDLKQATRRTSEDNAVEDSQRRSRRVHFFDESASDDVSEDSPDWIVNATKSCDLAATTSVNKRSPRALTGKIFRLRNRPKDTGSGPLTSDRRGDGPVPNDIRTGPGGPQPLLNACLRGTIIHSAVNKNFASHPALTGIRQTGNGNAIGETATDARHRTAPNRMRNLFKSHDAESDDAVVAAGGSTADAELHVGNKGQIRQEVASPRSEHAENTAMDQRYVQHDELVRLEQMMERMSRQLGELLALGSSSNDTEAGAALWPAGDTTHDSVAQIRRLGSTLDDQSLAAAIGELEKLRKPHPKGGALITDGVQAHGSQHRIAQA